MTVKGERPKKHFSMVRGFHLADLFTLANAACGVGAVFAAMDFMSSGARASFFVAAGLAPLAFVFDALDGRVARWRQKVSPMGRELDSLSDIISFGMAPAALAFAAGMRGALDIAVLIFFVCCGVSRLARFNITAEELAAGSDKVKYFEGTPIPTSVALVLVLAGLGWTGRLGADLPLGELRVAGLTLHPLVLMFALSGGLMISKTVRIPKF